MISPGTIASGRLDDTDPHTLHTVGAGEAGVGLKLVMVNVDPSDETLVKVTITRSGETGRRYPQAEIQEDGGSARWWLGELSEGDAVSAQLSVGADVDWTLTGGINS